MTSTLEELADRIEAAEGPDRELDWDIFCLHQPDRLPYFEKAMAETKTEAEKNGTWAVRPKEIIEWQRGLFSPRYTASLDAAMSLVPEGWALEKLEQYYTVRKNAGWGWAATLKPVFDPSIGLCFSEMRDGSAAQVVTAASLRALAQEQ